MTLIDLDFIVKPRLRALLDHAIIEDPREPWRVAHPLGDWFAGERRFPGERRLPDVAAVIRVAARAAEIVRGHWAIENGRFST